ncbi:MAG: tRNA (N6-isopentenyl adenosine(37)-C2)-methylthiotransferase MiaB [Armatimonadetes bacterium]|nr:tRNA (N6-isopentenyl adenosine(37)-C2)-methylthiotransferase MiaB [Armatimonadota bacterium]
MRTYHIETFGCQMNEHDSEGIAGILSGLGLSPVPTPEEADVLVLNTCSVRDKPQRKVFSRLGQYEQLRSSPGDRLIVVAGCMAQLIPDEIRERSPGVDLVIGPRAYGELETAVRRLMQGDATPQRVLTRCAPDAVPIPYRRESPLRARVDVMYGCDNHCAYCVVPRARGEEVSRQPDAVLREVEQLVAEGVVEVTLLGQNVNSYGRGLEPRVDFADLLARLDGIEGLQRIRFTTSHPKDVSPRLIRAMAQLPSVCEHLHLPIQAGSDRVLERMGRGHTAQQYLTLVRAVRETVPGLSLTTDVMVGFPGETREDFEATLALFEAVRFDQAFMFRYNDRPGTRADEMTDKVPEEEKQARFIELVRLQNGIAREVNEAHVGEVLEVLVEGRDPKNPEKARGRTRQNKLVIFPADEDLTGRFVHVRAVEARLWGWLGDIPNTVQSW